jgi:hypothetical protein
MLAAALNRRQVHGQRGAVEGDLRVPERVLRAGAGEGRGGGGSRRRRQAEGYRHGDDAAGELVPLAAQEHLPGAAQHAGEPVGAAGAVRRQRRDGHLGAGGLPPRQAGPGRSVRRHARQLELQGGGGRGGVQEPAALRGHRRRRRRWCATLQ